MKYQLLLAPLVAVAASKCSASDKASSTGSSAAVQSLYGQCGGQGWTGATACANGAVCQAWNDYYHQCVAGQTTFASSVVASSAPEVATLASSSQPAAGPTSVGQSSAPVATSSAAPVKSSSAAAAASPSSKAAASSSSAAPASSVSAVSSAASSSSSTGSGTVYKASFTQYGSTDTWGSGTCLTKTAACGWYSNPGFNAAVSENFFGVGPGAGAGPGCGTCWALTPETDSSNNKLSGASSIVIKVNNLCPASGNPLCSQSGKTGTNQYGANVNFDLCIDTGASAALFGSSGVGLAVGTATEVDCSEWSGTDIKRRMTI